MATNITNKAKEVTAWIERCGPCVAPGHAEGCRSVVEVAFHIKGRWPDLDLSIRTAILETAIAAANR